MTRKMLRCTFLGLLCCTAVTFAVFAATGQRGPIPRVTSGTASQQADVKQGVAEQAPGNRARAARETSTFSAQDKQRLSEEYAGLPENRRPGYPLDQGMDDCPGTMISDLPYSDSGTTTGFTNSVPGCPGSGPGPDVVYVYTPETAQTVTVSLCGSSYPTELQVRYGAACPGATVLGCNNQSCGQQSQLHNYALTAGTTYWIIVGGYWEASGAYVLSVTEEPPCLPGPANDNCANAGGPHVVPSTFSGDNTCATHDCYLTGHAGDGETWELITLTQTGDLTLDYCNTAPGWNEVFSVLVRDCPCGSFIYSSSQHMCANGNYSFTYNRLPYGNYYYPVKLDAAHGAIGPYTINTTFVPCLVANDDCANAAGPHAVPSTFTGDNTCATRDCSLLTDGEGETWELITLTQPCDLTLDFCSTAPGWNAAYDVLIPDCPCSSLIYSSSQRQCGNGNWSFTWNGLAAGNYYYPVLLNAASGARGSYRINATVESRVCEPATALTIAYRSDQGNNADLSWYASQTFGHYRVFGTTVMNNGGDPDNGANPDWTLVTEIPAPVAPGYQTCSVNLPVPYMNYAVVHYCGPANDDCENAVVIPGFPFSDTRYNTGATEQCSYLSGGVYGDSWYAFTIADTSNLMINYCGTWPAFANAYHVLDQGCPCSGNWIIASHWTNSTCGDANYGLFWNGLPAGTYYWPVLNDQDGSEGVYTVNFALLPHCAAGASSCAMIQINLVNLNTIDNWTGCGGANNYGDYTYMSTTLDIGTEYGYYVYNEACIECPDAGVDAWVDWNNDGSFSDPGEYSPGAGSGDGSSFVGGITPPSGSSGTHRLRFRIHWANPGQPCGILASGEVEDYTIIVP